VTFLTISNLAKFLELTILQKIGAFCNNLKGDPTYDKKSQQVKFLVEILVFLYQYNCKTNVLMPQLDGEKTSVVQKIA